LISTFDPWDLRKRTLALGTKENAVDVVNAVDPYVSRPTEASHRRYVAAHGVSLLVASSAAASMTLLMG
jgi:hypothetical protein